MLSHLSSTDTFILAASFCFGAGALGWLADGVVHQVGFGILGNALLALSGAVGSVVLLDKVTSEHWISLSVAIDPATLWIGAAVAGGTVLLLAAFAAKSLAVR